MEWLPIESALRDGTRIRATDGKHVVTTKYDGTFAWMHEERDVFITQPLTGWRPLPAQSTDRRTPEGA